MGREKRGKLEIMGSPPNRTKQIGASKKNGIEKFFSLKLAKLSLNIKADYRMHYLLTLIVKYSAI